MKYRKHKIQSNTVYEPFKRFPLSELNGKTFKVVCFKAESGFVQETAQYMLRTVRPSVHFAGSPLQQEYIIYHRRTW